MKIFSAFGRLIRAMIYTLLGDVSKWSEVWESSSSYIHAEYDDIKKEQIGSIESTTDAVSGLMELTAQKEARLEKLSKDIESYSRKKAGAKAKADKQVQKMKNSGASVESIKNDPTVMKCLEFYDNFRSTLEAKEEEAEIITSEIEKHQASLVKYKLQLQKMHTELKNIDQEKHETIADMEIAKAEQKVSNTLLGLSQSKTDERRQRIQSLRRKNRARADIKAEIAGVATEDVEAEFEEFAASSEAQDEFFDLIGLEEKTPAEATQDEEESRIPE